MKTERKYWLLKSEPFKYSWDDLERDKSTIWDGVRNFQARNNLKAMKVEDYAFFYHSNEGKEVVGIVKITKEAHQDPTTEENWVVVEVKPLKKLPQAVTLETIKQDILLANMALVKQPRLSVCPVTTAEFDRICELSGVNIF